MRTACLSESHLGCLRFARLKTTMLLVVLSSFSNAQEPDPSNAENAISSSTSPASELKLKAIQFYSSGLARFRYEAWVETETNLQFTVLKTSVSDVLRTISVSDSEQGLKSIHVHGEQPTSKQQSQKPEVDLSSRIDLLLSQRGETMEFQVKGGEVLAGNLVSVEKSLEAFGDSISERVRVSLLSEDGIQTALLDDIVSFRCLDPESQSRLEESVRELSEPITETTKVNSDLAVIEIALTGDKRRKVDVSLMQSMPVWKCSYVLNDDELRMHVVIDNPTDQDWDDVELSVSDGRPIAFDIDLHQSVRLERQQLALPVGIPGLPPIFEESIAAPSRSQDSQIASNGMYGGAGYGAEAGGYGGMGGMGMGGMGGSFGGEPVAGDPFASNLSAVVSAPSDALDLAFQQQAAKEGNLEGAPLQLRFPVTSVPAHSSTLLASPKLNCEASHCSVFAPDYDSQNPLMAIEFVNRSKTLLPAGPLTFNVKGRYQGEAMLERTSSNANKLITFALDTAVRIEEKQETRKQAPGRFVFNDDGKSFEIEWTNERTRTFKAYNSTADARNVIIYLPSEPDWELVAPKLDDSDGRDLRVRLTAEPGAETVQEVRFAMKTTESHLYATCELSRLRQLISTAIAPKDREKLEKILKHRLAANELSKQLKQIQKNVSEVEGNVDRLVKVLSTRGLQAATVQRYATRIETGEAKIEELLKLKEKLQSTLLSHEQELRPPEEPFDFFLSSEADPFGGSSEDPFGSDPFGN